MEVRHYGVTRKSPNITKNSVNKQSYANYTKLIQIFQFEILNKTMKINTTPILNHTLYFYFQKHGIKNKRCL